MAPTQSSGVVSSNNGEEIPSELRNRRSAARARSDSDDSTIGAFYANPTLLEPYARRKLKQMQKASMNHAVLIEMDLSGVFDLGIEQEGAKDRLAALVGRPSNDPVPPFDKMPLADTNSRGSPPIADGNKNWGLQVGPLKSSDNDSAKSPTSKISDFDFISQAMPHGILQVDQVESSAVYPTIRNERQVSTTCDESVQSGLGGDRFFMEENDRRSSFHLNGQVRSSYDGIEDSLRYSDHTAEAAQLAYNTHRNSMFDNLSGVLDGVFSFRKRGLPLSLTKRNSFIRKGHQPTVESSDSKPGKTQPKARTEQHSADTTEPVYSWPPMTYTENKEAKHAKGISSSVDNTNDWPESVIEPLILWMDPTPWLEADAIFPPSGDQGKVHFPEDYGHKSLRGFVRTFLFNPIYPEFTSLQQFVWSIIIGVAMGFYTAFWKYLIDGCVDFFWVVVPTFLRNIGFFTDIKGNLPMTHYMWICPTVFGSSLSYIFASLSTKIPGQNQWIQNVHSKGVQESDTFLQLFLLSTLGMASGLSLGPELPLVLTAGMVGSYLGIMTKQSVLQARVLNLVAASSAVGGFFGFPMAGALYVLEIPHRMGLQYFEALSPAIFGSIVAVLTNRMVINNDVTGYYKYPFLTDTLPSTIFWHAIIFGLYGTCVGIGYAKGVQKVKDWVHNIFQTHISHVSFPSAPASPPARDRKGSFENILDVEEGCSMQHESTPLLHQQTCTRNLAPRRRCLHQVQDFINGLVNFNVKHNPTRAAVSGAIAGFLVGVTGMFLPHCLFWGEAQLQNVIDKGKSPLPIFGRGDDPTADLTAWAFCMIDPDGADVNEYSLGCSALITVSKIFVTGLSLGTGIIGGHFWGPLFTGCIASHFFTDFADMVGKHFGINPVIGTYPCVAILCTMGATHVVTFRAHTAIMLILTLTISAFNAEESTVGFAAGDYSAVFPLLVVSVYVSLMISRNHVKFYSSQRNRGDILALPEVLCEPGKAGSPMIVNYDVSDDDESNLTGSEGESASRRNPSEKFRDLPDFDHPIQGVVESAKDPKLEHNLTYRATDDTLENIYVSVFPTGPDTDTGKGFTNGLSSTRLDELLALPLPDKILKSDQRGHRRAHSASALLMSDGGSTKTASSRSRAGHRRTRTTLASDSPSNANSRVSAAEHGHDLVRVTAFGEIQQFQPSLMNQARARASSLHRVAHRRSSSQSRSAAHNRIDSGDLSCMSDSGSNWLQMLVDDTLET